MRSGHLRCGSKRSTKLGAKLLDVATGGALSTIQRRPRDAHMMRGPFFATTAIAGALLALVLTGNAFAIMFESQVATAAPLPGTGCTVPTAKTAFAANDSRVYLWL